MAAIITHAIVHGLMWATIIWGDIQTYNFGNCGVI